MFLATPPPDPAPGARKQVTIVSYQMDVPSNVQGIWFHCWVPAHAKRFCVPYSTKR